MKLCVVGAGIVGSSTAVRLKQAFPDAELTVYSDGFSPFTTGDGSGGFWQPHLLRDTPEERVKRWSRDTFQLCEALWRGPLTSSPSGLEGLRRAVSLVPCYDLMDGKHSDNGEGDAWKATVYDHRWLSAQETHQLGFPRQMVGHSFLSYVYEPKIALPIMYEWLRKQPKVNLISRKIRTLDELIDQGFDLVAHCTGAGARYLANDDNIKPISGHVLRVKAPWVHFVMASADDVYVIPNQDSVVVGSINKFNNWDTSIDPLDKDASARLILERCAEQLCPRLKEAEIVDQWVGLRPFRLGGVRLEHEWYKKKLHVIHNYGHGGCGVTLSWGCARQVVDMARTHFEAQGHSRL